MTSVAHQLGHANPSIMLSIYARLWGKSSGKRRRRAQANRQLRTRVEHRCSSRVVVLSAPTLRREHARRKRRLSALASFSAWLVTPRPGRGFISTRTGFAYARRLRGTRTLFTTCSRTPTSCMAWAKIPSRHRRKHEPSSKSGSRLGERTGSVPSLLRPRLPTGRWSARPVS